MSLNLWKAALPQSRIFSLIINKTLRLFYQGLDYPQLINGESRERIKSLMLSNGDLEILRHVACGLNRTSMIARHEGKSSSNIRSRLKRLRDKVYLARSFVLSETGGDEYVYRCIYKL